MSKIREITVSLDLLVQTKQYQSIKASVSMTRCYDEELKDWEGHEFDVGAETTELRKLVGVLVRQAVHEETEIVYGKAVADYVVNQTGKETK